ncbi:MAG: ABC transporter ATP-binding protein [Eubacteriales bacterium]|nr:ABC transporter ATP-binding protein [Eubacteriales bacterium]
MENKVEIRDLSYKVPDMEILRDVSMRVENEQFIGLIGPNGSGKTSLLKHIYRALPPQKRTVFINGREVESYSYRETARHVTVMRQENSSDFDYSILEMVLMGRAPYRKYYEPDTNEDKEIAHYALCFVGMEDKADRSFSTLSGGEKQRVLIARSLAQEADILLLDEPTNHLDVHYQWLVMETISKLKKTVLSVFHDLNLACRFCDYIYVLKDGRIVSHGRPELVVTPEMLSDIFGVKADIISVGAGKPYVIYQNSLP